MVIAGQARANMWNVMTRRFKSKNCPPILVDRWNEAGSSRFLKNDCFTEYLNCGVGLSVLMRACQFTTVF
eukprot:14003776-Alexandrium_andersonii.AAC.1